MQEQTEKYIKDIETELEALEVKVNPNGSISGKSRYLLERNGDRAKELTAQLKGFKDALKILNRLE